jgi:hypothetical protein
MALKVSKPNPGIDYSKHLESKPIEGTVSVEKKNGKDSQFTGGQSESVTLHPGVFNKKNSGMSINVVGGRTLNLGNYESARVDVHVTVPCDPETLNEAFEFASEWISGKINEAVKSAKGI